MITIDSPEVTFTITVDQDEQSVRGNAMASGDDADDKAVEDEIIARLDCGDVWAWCHVRVTASFAMFEGSDQLGGCSYKDEAEFRSGDYFKDMKQVAFDDMLAKMKAAAVKLAEVLT